jgi:hypothetical protein
MTKMDEMIASQETRWNNGQLEILCECLRCGAKYYAKSRRIKFCSLKCNARYRLINGSRSGFYSNGRLCDVDDKLKEIFDKSYKVVDGHWIWTGKISRNRGWLSYKSLRFSAPILSYWLHKGPTSEGSYICHTRDCNISLCVRPEHIYDGNPRTNYRDTVAVHGHAFGRKVS